MVVWRTCAEPAPDTNRGSRIHRSQLSNAANFQPFLEQMHELGYMDGSSVVFDRRFADGQDELVGEFVADLVRRAVEIIVVTGTRESLAAKQATSTFR